MLNGFTWPNSMPQGMEDLCNYQALTASSIEYFDLAMERLQQRYLLSKRQIPVRKWIKYSTIVTVSLLLLIGIVWAVLFYLSIDVCTKYATCIVKDAYAGTTIKNYDEMKAAFKEYGNAKVEFIRLNDGKFEENTFDWEETGIVGLLDLTE